MIRWYFPTNPFARIPSKKTKYCSHKFFAEECIYHWTLIIVTPRYTTPRTGITCLRDILTILPWYPPPQNWQPWFDQSQNKEALLFFFFDNGSMNVWTSNCKCCVNDIWSDCCLLLAFPISINLVRKLRHFINARCCFHVCTKIILQDTTMTVADPLAARPWLGCQKKFVVGSKICVFHTFYDKVLAFFPSDMTPPFRRWLGTFPAMMKLLPRLLERLLVTSGHVVRPVWIADRSDYEGYEGGVDLDSAYDDNTVSDAGCVLHQFLLQ
jgi:hypothetical protein